jgi:translocation and assembly module TamB
MAAGGSLIDDQALPGNEPDDVRPRSWWRWLLVALLLVAVLLAALVPTGLWFLSETPRGRAFVAERVSGLSPESGIRYEVGRIDGSLLSKFELIDVVVKDLDGTLALIPSAKVDWEPVTLVGRLVSINRIDVPEIRVLRMWSINPRDPEKPLLPDIDIRVGRFDIARLVLEKPLLGRREVLRAVGRADIRAGRLLLDMQATAQAGDRLLLLLDAEPDRDRFDLEADLRAPAGGAISAFTGIDQPLTVLASGNGTWSRWRGQLNADMGTESAVQRLVALSIQADDGLFRVRGALNPSPLMSGALAAFVEPDIDIDLTARRAPPSGLLGGDSRFELRFVASSQALALSGGGIIDTQANLLDGVRVEAVLKAPQLVNPGLSGRGMRATITADGDLVDPSIQWTVRADSVRFAGESGPIGADAVVADGRVQLANDTRPLTVSFTATSGPTTGLPPEVAALLQQPRLSGTLTLDDGTLNGRNLQLTTSQMTARGSAALRPDGRATANLDAQLARFEVPNVGPVSLRAVASISRAPGGRPAVDGRFEARSLGLANTGASDFLGGPPSASGNFALGPDGRIAISAASFTSPNLQFAGARGSYDPASGRFTLDAAGRSRVYGPVSIVASGTSTAPTATIKLASPGFGFGVTDVVAEIRPAPGGVGIVATGDSAQGPLDGRLVIGFGEGQPLRIDVERVAIANISASGQLVQTAAGPFAGALVVDGQGVDARFRFSAQGAIQRVDATAQALNARLPFETPISINSGSASFAILLVPDRPTIKGSFQLSGVRRDTLVLTTAEGSADIAGDRGQATVKAEGRLGDGQAFAGTARVQSVSNGYAIGLDGRVGNRPMKLERPARLVRMDDGWQLMPARLVLPKGQIDVAGQWGEQRELRLVLRDVDLGIVDLLSSSAGLGGTASGQVVLRSAPGAVVPTGEINVEIKSLQRAGITGLSVPVDVRLAGTSDGSGLVLGARMSWQGNQLGRLVMRVDPGPGETPAERFMAGRLSGGVRYSGPIEPLWALSGLEGQEMKGPIAIGADFAGTPADPQLTGIARGKGIIYRNAGFGTEITDLAFEGSFTGSSLRIASLTGKANGGTLTGSGFIRLDADAEQQVNLTLDLQRARLANSDTIEMTMSGPLRLEGTLADATLSGNLRVDTARIQLVQVETSEVPQLKVRRAGEIRIPEKEQSLSATNLKLNVRVQADDRIRVEGMGLDSIWRADIRLRGTARAPLLLGTATLAEGEFTFAGSDFDLTRGRVDFNGKPLDSSINIQAQTVAEDVTAFVTISGTAARPDVRFSSSPTLPEDEILSRLLFGSSVADLSVTEAVQLATAIAGLQSGVDTMGKIRRSVGVDRLRLVGENEATGMSTGLAIGKRLTRNIYVEVLTDSQGNTLTTVQLTLSRALSLLLEVSSIGQSSVNLRYQKDY